MIEFANLNRIALHDCVADGDLAVAAHGYLIFVSDAKNGGAVKRLHREIRGLSIFENAVVRFGQKRSNSGLRILALSLSQSNAELRRRLIC